MDLQLNLNYQIPKKLPLCSFLRVDVSRIIILYSTIIHSLTVNDMPPPPEKIVCYLLSNKPEEMFRHF